MVVLFPVFSVNHRLLLEDDLGLMAPAGEMQVIGTLATFPETS